MRRRRTIIEAIAVAFAGTAWVAVAGRVIEPLWYQGDAPRHAMNGAFYLDLPGLLERGLGLVGAAESYYACRPAIAPNIWPPVFPITEAIGFAAFGVASSVARVVVLAWCGVALFCFHLLLRPWLGALTAAAACLLLAASPGMVVWSNSVMLEVPGLAMCLLSALAIAVHARTGSRLALGSILPLEALAVLTNPRAAILLPFTAILWLRGGKRSVLHDRALWLGAAIGGLVLAPWVYVTVAHAPILVEQVTSLGDFGAMDLANWTYYLDVLRHEVGLPLAVCGTIAAAVSVFSKRLVPRGLAPPLHAWAITAYVVLSLIRLKQPRYALVFAPYFAVLVACSLARLGERMGDRIATCVLVGALAIAGTRWLESPVAPRQSAFDDVARFLAERSSAGQPTAVLYDGYYDGDFVFAVRSTVSDVPLVVYRGAKHLYATRIHAKWGLETLAATDDAIRRTIDGFNCRFVVVERDPRPDVDPARRLRLLLGDEHRFERLSSFRTGGATGDLIVYRNLAYDPARPFVEEAVFAFPAERMGAREVLRCDWRRLWPRADG